MRRKKKAGSSVKTGRPKGSYGPFRQALIDQGDKLVSRAIKEALRGDVAMLKICIERLVPRLRPQAQPVEIDVPNGGLVEIGEAVVQSAVAGRISPDAARDLLSALGDVARLKESTEFEERLAVLETTDHAPPWERDEDIGEIAQDEKLPIRGRHRRNSK